MLLYLTILLFTLYIVCSPMLSSFVIASGRYPSWKYLIIYTHFAERRPQYGQGRVKTISITIRALKFSIQTIFYI